ncbi:MAG: WD40 repeat domain-containing protein [Pirellulaceae bacterium]
MGGIRDKAATNNNAEGFALAWSPDDQLIAAATKSGGIENCIRLSETFHGASGPYCPATSVAWSPDGQSAVFVAGWDGSEFGTVSTGKCELLSLRVPNGSPVRNLMEP